MFTVVIIAYFRMQCLFHWIMFVKLLVLIFVSVYYNSLMPMNVLAIFVGIDDIPLLTVIFLLCH